MSTFWTLRYRVSAKLLIDVRCRLGSGRLVYELGPEPRLCPTRDLPDRTRNCRPDLVTRTAGDSRLLITRGYQ